MLTIENFYKCTKLEIAEFYILWQKSRDFFSSDTQWCF